MLVSWCSNRGNLFYGSTITFNEAKTAVMRLSPCKQIVLAVLIPGTIIAAAAGVGVGVYIASGELYNWCSPYITPCTTTDSSSTQPDHPSSPPSPTTTLPSSSPSPTDLTTKPSDPTTNNLDWLLERFRTAINVLADSIEAGIVSPLSRQELREIETMDGGDLVEENEKLVNDGMEFSEKL